VPAAVTVDVADIFKVLHPLIKTKKIKVGRRNKIDRVFVSVKKPADFRDIPQNGGHTCSPCLEL
jgi:hypothetical protein